MNPYRGQTFVRAIKSLGVARGDVQGAVAYAQSQAWPNARDVIASIRAAAVPATDTSDMTPASPAESDFSDFIRPMTILGKLTGLRRAPSRVRMIAATTGSTAFWSGESNPRPISRATMEGEAIEPLSVTAILVTTRELLRSSAPAAEQILSRDLANAAVAALDVAFIDPANAGDPGVKPASITDGVTPLVSSGTTLSLIDADLQALIDALSFAGSDLQFATWIMRPRTATYLARLRGTGGAPAFPQMSAKGGVLLGLPAITSAHVPVEVGSPGFGDSSITLLDPSQVLVADDGGSALQVSEGGALQMEDAPGSGAQSLVSLWQTDAAGLKTTRYANWRRVRDGMAQVLTVVQY
jgi:HK97 family phage major capsid protein